jgi:hypothetical protein
MVLDPLQQMVTAYIFITDDAPSHSEGRPMIPMHLVNYCLIFGTTVEKVLLNWQTTTLHTLVTTGRRKVNAMKFKEKMFKKKTLHNIVYEYNRKMTSGTLHFSRQHIRNFLCNRCLALPVHGKHIGAHANRVKRGPWQKKREMSPWIDIFEKILQPIKK